MFRTHILPIVATTLLILQPLFAGWCDCLCVSCCCTQNSGCCCASQFGSDADSSGPKQATESCTCCQAAASNSCESSCCGGCSTTPQTAETSCCQSECPCGCCLPRSNPADQKSESQSERGRLSFQTCNSHVLPVPTAKPRTIIHDRSWCFSFGSYQTRLCVWLI